LTHCQLNSAPHSPPGSPRDLPLVERYQQLFQGIIANTPQLLRESYRLRYQVYCVEHSFLDPAENPGGLERDRYDEHSVHTLLRHRKSGTTVGTMRLVLHKPGSPKGSLPFHAVCQDPRVNNPDFLPAEGTAEFSRLAVSKMVRRRVQDGTYGQAYDLEELGGEYRRHLPHITFGLMTMTLQEGIKHGIEYVCAVMEPALLRLLARFGIHFEPIGPLVDYHGWRQPCYAQVRSLMERIERERPDIWQIITDRGRLWQSSLKCAPTKDDAAVALA
jgi:N-acyl amino acid synthase of PEP-CTERM/exosortase system